MIILDDFLAGVPPDSNSYKRQKEKIEYAAPNLSELDSLLPTLDDAAFGKKLVQHPEFRRDNEATNDKTTCAAAAAATEEDDRFLAHQLFVRHFLAPNSPYNGLLLYHSPSANQMCVAIGVAEEWRNVSSTIYIWTHHPEAFRKTLFQPDMLEVKGSRVVAKKGCATESLLRTVNPLNAPMTLEEVVEKMEHLVETSYQFVDDRGMEKGSLVIVDNYSPLPEIPPGVKLLLLQKSPQDGIIELTNLLNANDERGLLEENEVFDPVTNKFVEERKENGHLIQEGGYNLLHRKLNGYVSFLSSATNTEAVRLYPDVFSPDRVFRSPFFSLMSLFSTPTATTPMPKEQINGNPFPSDAALPSLYLTPMGDEQEQRYTNLVKQTTVGASLRPLLTSLVMTYPATAMAAADEDGTLESVVEKGHDDKYIYRNDDDTFRLFAKEGISKYSGKLTEMCRLVASCSGKILIMTRNEEEVMPVALALEDHDLVERQLFARQGDDKKEQQRKKYSTHTNEERETSIYILNKTCEKRLEGIRQVHFLSPPESMNRLEEILANVLYPRSHCSLEPAQRNVEVYLHASVSSTSTKETADVYAYRVIMEKAKAMGRVTRLLKEVAVDALLANPRRQGSVEMKLSNAKPITVDLANVDNRSATCDYMETCMKPPATSLSFRQFKETPLVGPAPQITQRIRQLFQEKAVYPRQELLDSVQRPRLFPLQDILVELSRLVRTKSDVIYDKYGRRGYLVQQGTSYAFQPVEITDTDLLERERVIPVSIKPEAIDILPEAIDILPEAIANNVLLPQQTKKISPTEVALCVDVATGDSDVKLRDPWYKTVSEWFNELQLIHRVTADQVRQIVVDRAIEVMSKEQQLDLLERMYGKIRTDNPNQNPTEARIKDSLDRCFQRDGTVQLGLRRFRQVDGKWQEGGHHHQQATPRRWWTTESGEFILDDKALATMPKQDLLVRFTKIHPKRKVSSKQIAVLVEILVKSGKKI